jgi:hypothetical protein
MGEFLIRSPRVWGSKGDKGGAGGADGSGLFNGMRPITRVAETIFGFDPETTTVDQFLNAVFYPPEGPEATISVNDPIREIGASTAYTLDWTATEESAPITGITVNGVAKTPTGNTQSGTQTGSTATATGTYTFPMTDTDGTLTGAASCSIEYLARIFWGSIAKDGLSDAPILDSDILALPNSALQANFDLNLTNFGGGAKYLIFAWPTSYGVPQFIVNGLTNTAFTAVRANSNFVNAEGATVVMDVWVSNNLYNSPLGSVIVQ